MSQLINTNKICSLQHRICYELSFKSSYECFIFYYDKSYTRSDRHIISKLVNELHSHVIPVTTIVEYQISPIST